MQTSKSKNNKGIHKLTTMLLINSFFLFTDYPTYCYVLLPCTYILVQESG